MSNAKFPKGLAVSKKEREDNEGFVTTTGGRKRWSSLLALFAFSSLVFSFSCLPCKAVGGR